MLQIAFNLYPFSDTLLLPSANLVDSDAGGHLTHLKGRATLLTIPSYGIPITPVIRQLLDIVDMLTPKNLEAKFKAPKAKTALSLDKLLADEQAKKTVEAFIFRQLDIFLTEITRNQLPLTLDVERKMLAKDVQIEYPAEPLMPLLSFVKSETGIEYSLQLVQGEKRLRIQERDIRPVTNTDPAWLLDGYRLYRVAGINGNMVKPFSKRDKVLIPRDKERMYFRQFIAKSIRRSQVEAEGFQVQRTKQLLHTRLETVENVLERRWFLKPVFEYTGAEFVYGDRRDRVTSLDIPDNDHEEVTVHLISRDEVAEKAKLERLGQLGLQDDGRGFFLSEQSELTDLLHLLATHRVALESDGFVLQQPQWDGRPIALHTGTVSLRSEAAGDWFDLHGSVVIGPWTFPFQRFLTCLRKRDRFFLLPDDSFFIIPEQWFAQYADIAAHVQEQGEQLRIAKTLYTVLQESDAVAQNLDLPIIDTEKIDYQPSVDLQATLRPYQLLGVKWLIGHYQHGFGACLADDMGLGKTLQTIAVLLYAKAQKAQNDGAYGGGGQQLDLFSNYQQEMKPLQALIVLPASLVFNWQQELRKFAPSLFVLVQTGPKRLRDARALGGYDVVLTTYHTARQDLELLGKINWHYIILDESQQIKNRESEVSKVVRALQGQNRISLSGTPIENSLADLWTQMEFINPDTLGSFKSFRENFIQPIEKQRNEQAKQKLFNRVKPYFLRRTKEEVAPDLPLKTEIVFFTEMQPEQAKWYDKIKSAVRNEMLGLFADINKNRFEIFAALTRLRQLANHPRLIDGESFMGSGKFDDVRAQWETIRRAGHKALFFSSFEKHLRLFRSEMEAQEQPFAWLTGDCSAAERQQAVETFQQRPEVQALLMTTKAGGVGLNLTAADYVFLLDPWWNPAVEAQAIARAHRIGQEKPVTVVRFIAKETIEEKILLLQEQKRKLGENLFSNGLDEPSLKREDLEFLLVY